MSRSLLGQGHDGGKGWSAGKMTQAKADKLERSSTVISEIWSSVGL